MKKNIITLAMVLIISVLYAQKNSNIVYLKNGSIIKGNVLEKTETNIKIETKDGSIWVFEMTEVDKITEEENQVKKRELKEKGFVSMIGTGFAVYPDEAPIYSPKAVFGYKFKFGLVAGAGFGFETLNRRPWIPVFGHIHYEPFKKTVSPFVYLQSGYNLLPDLEEDYYIKEYGGLYVEGGLGVIFNLDGHAGITFTIGYAHRQSSETHFYYYYYNKPEMYQNYFYRIVWRVGILLR